MPGKFITAARAEREHLDWGSLGWFSRPTTTEAEQLVVIEVNLRDGGGHNFHKHPQQGEVIYVIDGTIEQWLRDEKHMLSAGDSVFIPADAVHASFNTSGKPAKLLAILSTCVGEEGYQLVDVADRAPWNNLRT